MPSPCIAIVGMNAVGKSNFGKRLSAKLKRKRIDTDTEFEKQYGDRDVYIEEHGWDAFRSIEEAIVLKALLPGHIVVLSGGAIESEHVRAELDQCTVIWLQAGQKRIEKHIAEAKRSRPEFAKGSPAEVAAALLAQRDPLYASVADITIRDAVPYGKILSIALAELRKFEGKSQVH